MERGDRGPALPSAVLVPVKAFSLAKLRLAPTLDGPARHDLARGMATRVLAAASPLPVTVVCDDPEVAAWAETRGAEVCWTPGRGLNAAVTDGVRLLAARGMGRVVVAHADLPMARGLAALASGAGVTLVPDRRGDGTNVVVLPAAADFSFSYGPHSFGRHCHEASRLGLSLRVVRSAALAWDVDLPSDLDLPDRAPCS